MADTPSLTKAFEWAATHTSGGFVTYFFKAPRLITREEASRLGAHLKLSGLCSFTPVGKLDRREYHAAFFLNGGTLKHDGKQLNLGGTTVEVGVSSSLPSLVSTSKDLDEGAKALLNSLKVLDPEYVQDIQKAIAYFIANGQVAFDERNAAVYFTKEKLKAYGGDVVAKKVIPLLGKKVADSISALSAEEQSKKLDLFITAVASVGVSVKNIADSISILLKNEKEFYDHVQKWFNPVLSALKDIVRSSESATNSLVAFTECKDEKEREDEFLDAISSFEEVSGHVKKLIKEIPAIQEKILTYAKTVEKLADQQKMKALGGTLLAILELGATALASFPKIINEGWKQLHTLEKVGFVLGVATGSLSLVEGTAACYTWATLNSNIASAKEATIWFDDVHKELESYDKTLDKVLAKKQTRDLLISLLEEVKSHTNELKTLLQRGEEMMKKKRNPL